MIKFFNNLLNPKTMANAKMKTCGISGNSFKADQNNFYRSSTSQDGLHPYHIQFDNLRRTTGIGTNDLRKLCQLVKNLN